MDSFFLMSLQGLNRLSQGSAFSLKDFKVIKPCKQALRTMIAFQAGRNPYV